MNNEWETSKLILISTETLIDNMGIFIEILYIFQARSGIVVQQFQRFAANKVRTLN